MFTDLKPYPEYADSGITWLGRLPAHWRVHRIKSLVRERVTKDHPGESLLAATQSHGVIRKSDYATRTVTAQKDLHLLKLVEVGDFVISLRSFQGGIERAYDRGIISPAYTVLHLHDIQQRDYLTLLFKSRPFVEGLTLCVTGIREGQNVDYVRLSRDGLPVPPEDEQAMIVKYLRHANARIDRAIAAKRKLIALLDEQKQAIIIQAVTRGLDPTVPLKDSGIPWIGDLPSHWDLVPARSFLRQRKIVVAENHSNYELLSLSLQGVIPRDLENSKGKFPSDFLSYQSVEPGNFVMCLFDVDETPRTVGLSARPGMVSGAYKVLRCEPQEFAPFLYYFLESLDDRKALKPLYTGLRKTIPLGQLLQSKVPIPPPAERASLVARIEAEASSARSAGERMRREIELLRQFRARLTADVVTGQVDIRAAAALLPELDPAELVGDLVQDADELEADFAESLEEVGA